MSAKDEPATTVAIRLLDVLDGDATRLEPLARCPRQGMSIDARRCVTCARMRSIAWDPKSGGEVSCTAEPEAVHAMPARADIAEIAARRRLHEVVAPVTRCITKEPPLARERALFADERVVCLPVIEGVMKLAGTVTRADALAAPNEGRASDLLLHQVSLPEHASIGSAIALMATSETDHVAVVTDEGDLLGIWSAKDALRWVSERMGYVIR